MTKTNANGQSLHCNNCDNSMTFVGINGEGTYAQAHMFICKNGHEGMISYHPDGGVIESKNVYRE